MTWSYEGWYLMREVECNMAWPQSDDGKLECISTSLVVICRCFRMIWQYHSENARKGWGIAYQCKVI